MELRPPQSEKRSPRWLQEHPRLNLGVPRHRGGPIHPRTMQTAITQVMNTAGIQDIRHAVHMLRAAPVRHQHRARGAGAVGPPAGESIEALKEEVKQLRQRVKDLTARLEAIEGLRALAFTPDDERGQRRRTRTSRPTGFTWCSTIRKRLRSGRAAGSSPE